MDTSAKNLLKGFDIFWGEIAPCDHLLQIYTSEDLFLDSLEGFVGGGMQKGDGVIVIATAAHVNALNHRLTTRGFNIETARSRKLYTTIDAQECLTKFMVKGWPDDSLFEQFVAELLDHAGDSGGRRVRAFGEIVALLCARGRAGAAIRLEQLWQKICQKEGLSLFCAYPKNGFSQDAEASIKEICAAHSKIL